MRSNYKRLGDYIKQVNVRNSDLSVTNLQGININKFFMPSVANIEGTDLTKYKVVSREQFAFNPMHVGRDEVLPISMLEEEEAVIVSPAYVVFEVKDKNKLLPEYLMMWCRRPEFDRNTWFTTDSSVRGGFSWQDFCDMKLPVPSINKQQEIVKEYNTIVNRIKLNEELNKKLEETAQAIYKHWFVDFEFHIPKEYAESIGKPELGGQPYKSNGGEMVYNEELQQEIPKGWEVKPFTKVVELKGGGTPSTEINSYWNGEIPFFTPKDVSSSYFCTCTEKHITNEGLNNCSSKLYPKYTVFLTARGTVGEVSIAGYEMAMNQSCYAVLSKKDSNQYFAHQLTLETLKKLKNEAMGAVFKALVTRDFDAHLVVKPESKIVQKYGTQVRKVYELILDKQKEHQLLTNLNQLILTQIIKQDESDMQNLHKSHLNCVEV